MTPLESYGVPGILIAGIVWLALFLKNLMKDHKDEREEWRRSQDRIQDQTNQNIKDNTNVLSGLKALIETLRK